jgi:MtN3 and saliva related transmembrane protein
MLIFGWMGGIINVFHVLPQMWKIWKTKSVEDISINSIIIKIIACSLYTIHGFIISDMPLLWMTAVVLAQYITIFVQYKYYDKVKKCDANIVASTQATTRQITTDNADRA